MKNNEKSRTEELLLGKFPLLMSFAEVSQVTGINAKTLHNWRCLRTLPFEARKIGGKWRVHIFEVAVFIDSFNAKETKKRGPGRPHKSEKYEIKN